MTDQKPAIGVDRFGDGGYYDGPTDGSGQPTDEYGDYAKALLSGGYKVASGVAGFEQAIGAGDSADQVRQWADRKDKEATDSMSPVARSAISGDVLGSSHPLMALGLKGTQMAPGLAVAIGAGAATGGLADAAGIGAEGAALAGHVGAGAGNAVLSAGATYGAIQNTVRNLPQEVMNANPDYRYMVKSGVSDEDARKRIADNHEGWTPAFSGLVAATAGFVGPEAGVVSKLTGGGAAGGLIARTVTGAGTGALQGAAQGGADSALQQNALADVTGEKFDLGKVAGAAAEGGVSGAALGALAAPFTGGKGKGRDAEHSRTGDPAVDTAVAADAVTTDAQLALPKPTQPQLASSDAMASRADPNQGIPQPAPSEAGQSPAALPAPPRQPLLASPDAMASRADPNTVIPLPAPGAAAAIETSKARSAGGVTKDTTPVDPAVSVAVDADSKPLVPAADVAPTMEQQLAQVADTGKAMSDKMRKIISVSRSKAGTEPDPVPVAEPAPFEAPAPAPEPVEAPTQEPAQPTAPAPEPVETPASAPQPVEDAAGGDVPPPAVDDRLSQLRDVMAKGGDPDQVKALLASLGDEYAKAKAVEALPADPIAADPIAADPVPVEPDAPTLADPTPAAQPSMEDALASVADTGKGVKDALAALKAKSDPVTDPVSDPVVAAPPATDPVVDSSAPVTAPKAADVRKVSRARNADAKGEAAATAVREERSRVAVAPDGRRVLPTLDDVSSEARKASADAVATTRGGQREGGVRQTDPLQFRPDAWKLQSGTDAFAKRAAAHEGLPSDQPFYAAAREPSADLPALKAQEADWADTHRTDVADKAKAAGIAANDDVGSKLTTPDHARDFAAVRDALDAHEAAGKVLDARKPAAAEAGAMIGKASGREALKARLDATLADADAAGIKVKGSKSIGKLTGYNERLLTYMKDMRDGLANGKASPARVKDYLGDEYDIRAGDGDRVKARKEAEAKRTATASAPASGEGREIADGGQGDGEVRVPSRSALDKVERRGSEGAASEVRRIDPKTVSLARDAPPAEPVRAAKPVEAARKPYAVKESRDVPQAILGGRRKVADWLNGLSDEDHALLTGKGMMSSADIRHDLNDDEKPAALLKALQGDLAAARGKTLTEAGSAFRGEPKVVDKTGAGDGDSKPYVDELTRLAKAAGIDKPIHLTTSAAEGFKDGEGRNTLGGASRTFTDASRSEVSHYNVRLANTGNRQAAIEVLRHEFGHVIDKHFTSTATQAEKRALSDAYKAWRERSEGQTQDQFNRDNFTPGQGLDYQRRQGGRSIMDHPDADYLMGTDEWFAREVAKHLTQPERRPGILGGLMDRVADAWRSVVKRITGSREDVPDATVAKFVTSRFGAAREPQPPAGGGRAVAVSKAREIAAAARQADRNPTPAQAEAGNYRKGHVSFDGLSLSIETPKGAMRKGIGADGKPWESKAPAHYGYIKGTEDNTGEHVDVYMGPNAESRTVHLVDQRNLDGTHDEPKAMLGFKDRQSALDAYHAAFTDGSGPDRMGGVHEMPFDDFKEWVRGPGPKRMADDGTPYRSLYGDDALDGIDERRHAIETGADHLLKGEGEGPEEAESAMRTGAGKEDDGPDAFAGMKARAGDHAAAAKAWSVRTGYRLADMNQLKQQLTGRFVKDGRDLVHSITANIQKIKPRKDELYKHGSEEAYRPFSELKVKNPKAAITLAELGQETTMANVKLVDTAGMAPDRAAAAVANANKHLSGWEGWQGRRQVADLNKRFMAMSPEARAAFTKMEGYFRKTQNDLAKQSVSNLMDIHDATIRAAGLDRAKLSERAMNGLMDAEDRTALGAQAFGDIKAAASVRALAGSYMPLDRYGSHLVLTRDALDAGKGEVVSADRARGDGVVRFTGKTEEESQRAAKEYAESTDHDVRDVTKRYIGKSGMEIEPEDFDPAKGHVVAHDVSVGLDGVHSFEGGAAAQRFIRENGKDFESVSEPVVRDSDAVRSVGLNDAAMARMLSAVDKSDLPDGAKEIAKDSIRTAALGIMRGGRAGRRRMTRRNIQGASLDMGRNALGYADAASRALAQMELLPQVRADLKAMGEQQKGARGSDTYAKDSAALQEINRRVTDATGGGAKSVLPKPIRQALAMSYMSKMFSPAHAVIWGMQPWTHGMPYLSGKHGVGRTFGEMGRAYSAMGAGARLGDSLANVYRAGKEWKSDFVDMRDVTGSIKKNLMGQKDGADLGRMLDSLRQRGAISDTAGLELEPLIAAGGKGLDSFTARTERVGNALLGAQDAIGRSVIATTAYRLGRMDGMTHEAATEHALDSVMNTQGSYDSATAAPMFNNPLMKPALQFRRFAHMQAHMMFDAVQRIVQDAKPGDRRAAVKQLAAHVGVTMMLAGAMGLPGLEMVKIPVMLAHLLGVGKGWDDMERKLKKAAEDQFGKTWGEILTSGGTRALGIDVSHRFSMNDYINPRMAEKQDQQGTAATLFSLLGGAPGDLLLQNIGAAHKIMDGDWLGGTADLIPNKFADDIAKGATRYASGQNSLLQAGTRAFGFGTAHDANVYDERMRVKSDRNDLKDQQGALIRLYTSALQSADKGKLAAATSRIRDFNKTAPHAMRLTPQGLGKMGARDATKAAGEANL